MSKSRELVDPSDDPQYKNLLKQIFETYSEGQRRAYQAVNEHLTATNWRIGQHIVEFEQGGKARAEYGTSLLRRLSHDLTLRHGKGFNRSGVIRIRQFYLAFPKGATASHLLSWPHFVEPLKIDDELERLLQPKVAGTFQVPSAMREQSPRHATAADGADGTRSVPATVAGIFQMPSAPQVVKHIPMAAAHGMCLLHWRSHSNV